MAQLTVIEELLQKIRAGEIRSGDKPRGRAVSRASDKSMTGLPKAKYRLNNKTQKHTRPYRAPQKHQPRATPTPPPEPEEDRNYKGLPFSEVFQNIPRTGRSWYGMPRPLKRTS